ncbi:MAG: MFS transporter [Elusimicrobiota bacterium]
MKRRVCLILAALLPLAGTSPALATVLRVSVAAGKSAPVSPAGAASVLRVGGSNISLGTVLPNIGLRSSLVGIQSQKLNLGGHVAAGAAVAVVGVEPLQAPAAARVAAPIRAVAPARAASFKKKITNLAERLTGKSSAKKETAALPSASHWAVFFDGGLKHDELNEEPAGFADELRAEAEAKLAHLKDVPGFAGFTIDTGAPDAYWKQLRGKRYVTVRWRHPNDLMRFHDSGGTYPQKIGGQLAITDYESMAGIRTIGVQLAPAKPETETKPEPAGPPTPSPAKKRQLRNYLLGTGIFKIGMESLGVSIPLLALTVYGSVTWAAVLAVGWGASQIVFSSFAGGLLDRHSPSKILSWAMGLQGLTVALLLSLFFVDMYLPGLLAFKLASPYMLLALYALAGGFMGVSDTARQVIPPEIIGERERDIKILNAKAHVAYEIAGVIGALATGAIIINFGLVPALILHPPAYLLAAYVFSKLKLGPRNVRKGVAGESANLEKDASPMSELAAGRPIRRAFSDLWKGAKTVWSKPIFRWSALALIVPLVLHRLLEGLLIPVAAKVLLGNPAMAAWIIGASNAGELIGAILLWRAIKNRGNTKRFRSHIWVRVMSLGVMGLWVFTLRPELWFILPLVAFGSMTWAASDLSLRSKLQNALPHRYRGRAFGFIGAVAFALILLASLGIGALMDTVAAASVFLGINIALVPLALLMFYAGMKLRKPKAPKPSK